MESLLLASLLSLLAWEQVDPRLHSMLEGLGVTRESFAGQVERLRVAGERRLWEGEADHLVYYVLQSTVFTSERRVEPALSAKTFHDRGAIPAEVSRRIDHFSRVTPVDPRHAALRRLAEERGLDIAAEYRRAMNFLREKEFTSRGEEGQARRDRVASLYQSRGHSTDTQTEATFAMAAGLATLARLDKTARIERVLLVGPGLDFAPRTEMRDDRPPQSFQPYALADALIARKLSTRDRLVIDCADINPRVVDFIRDFPRHPKLTLFWRPSGEELEAYFRKLGDAIGGGRAGASRSKTVNVDHAIASRIRARRRDIVTAAPDTAAYDLVVATNVLLYFTREELLLAINNIHATLRPGGHLLHNELRAEVEEFTRLLDFAPVQGQMIRLTPPGDRDLYDGFVLHRKR